MAELVPGNVTPVEPAAPAVAPEQTATAPESTAEPDKGTKAEAKPERTFTQKEVSEIAAKEARQAERRALRIAREEQDRFLRQQPAQTQQAPQPKGKPQLKDFQDIETFTEALADWKYGERSSAEREQFQRQSQQHAQQQEFHAVVQAAHDMVSRGIEQYPDFEEVVVQGKAPITPFMAKAMTESDTGHDIAYFLQKHPEDAKRIAALTPARQAHEILALESKLNAPAAPTKASPPIVPNEGTGAVRRSIDDPTLTDAEYNRMRREQIKRRRVTFG